MGVVRVGGETDGACKLQRAFIGVARAMQCDVAAGKSNLWRLVEDRKRRTSVERGGLWVLDPTIDS